MEKRILILNAIMWFCIGGLVTIAILKITIDKYVISDYQTALFECQKSRLDLIK